MKNSLQEGRLQARISNIVDTHKKISRIVTLLYLAALILLVTWFAVRFEGTELDHKIEGLDAALAVDSLRPWYEFLATSSSCFHHFYFGFEGGTVTKEDLQRYIITYQKENERREPFIGEESSSLYPIKKLTALIDSVEHWQRCTFWARQDSLVAFMFSLDYYLHAYFIGRTDAYFSNRLDSFHATFDSMTAVTDSVLRRFATQLDSLKSPFEYAVQVGWNPFIENGEVLPELLWGRWKEFDSYAHFDVEQLVFSLQEMNHVSTFKSLVMQNMGVLTRCSKDLQRSLDSRFKREQIRFSDGKNDIFFIDLDAILRSPLLKLPDLPDSIQPRKFSQLHLTYKNIYPRRLDQLVRFYFPEYLACLNTYKLDQIDGLRNWRQTYAAQRGSVRQRVQSLGVEISSRIVFYVAPGIVLVFSLLLWILLLHLGRLTKSNGDEIWDDDVILLVRETWLSPSLVGDRRVLLRLGFLCGWSVVVLLILTYEVIMQSRDGIGLQRSVLVIMALLLIVSNYLVGLASLKATNTLETRNPAGQVSQEDQNTETE